MTDQTFMKAAEATMAAIERALDSCDIDLDALRSGNVLTIELENGSKVIVNIQEAARELWLAAKSGGYHFRQAPPEAGQAKPMASWLDTRSGRSLQESLEQALTEQSGEVVRLS